MKTTTADFKNRGSTLFLRLAIAGMALIVVLFCVLVMPVIYREWPIELPHLASWRYWILFVFSASATAAFYAAYHIYKILNLIDRNKAFSKATVKELEQVKYTGYVVSGLSVATLPLVYFLADSDDAPGLILIFSAIFIGIPLVVAVFSSVCQRLFQNAIDMKKENDLTV